MKSPFYREPATSTASELGLGTWDLEQNRPPTVKIA